MTTSGPPTAATTGSPAPPAVASAAWIAWASCRGSAAGSTGLKARPATTTSLPRSSRQSALTDPLPMSRPMARRFRKSLRPIALSTTHRPVQRSPDARVSQITSRRKYRLSEWAPARPNVEPSGLRTLGIAAAVLPQPGGQALWSASREGSARDVPAAGVSYLIVSGWKWVTRRSLRAVPRRQRLGLGRHASS